MGVGLSTEGLWQGGELSYWTRAVEVIPKTLTPTRHARVEGLTTRVLRRPIHRRAPAALFDTDLLEPLQAARHGLKH